jgi:hypothetical protein
MDYEIEIQKPNKQDGRFSYETKERHNLQADVENGTYQSKTEIIIADYFRRQGYGVIKTHYRKGYNTGRYASKLKEMVEDKLDGDFREAGIPDLLVFDLSHLEEKLNEASVNNVRRRQYSDGLFLEVFVEDVDLEDVEYFFLEAKRNTTSLNKNQRDWIENHPEQEVKIARLRE